MKALNEIPGGGMVLCDRANHAGPSALMSGSLRLNGGPLDGRRGYREEVRARTRDGSPRR